MKFVIIGAGPAGVIAAEEIRRQDDSAEIVIVGKEQETPYSRMAIPYLIKNTIEEQGTHLRTSETHYDDHDFTIMQAKVETINTDAKQLVLSDQQTIDYDKLLVASGGKPLTPPIEGINLPGVYPCWTLDHARQIIKRAVEGSNIVLIGAGFISTTIVEALVKSGGQLTIVEMEDRVIPRMMGKEGSDIISHWCESKGVTIKTSSRVEKISEVDDHLAVEISGGEVIDANLVISATGVAPNISFLSDSGLDTDLGLLVDEFLNTSNADVYGAGDVVQAPDFLLNEKTVMAIQPVAAEHARLAAYNMVHGNNKSWKGSFNMNVLDMIGLVSCSFGLVDGVENGDSAQMCQADQNLFINLQFDGNVLIGASSVGFHKHAGVFQGLIQNKVELGEWKEKLKQDPTLVMDAWIGCSQGYV